MEFALHVPGAPLDRHIESMIFYAGFAPQHHREKLLPDGAIQIIVDLTDRPKRLYASEASPIGVDFAKSWISGMQRRWIVIEAQPASSMLIIRFRPGGTLAFLPHDAVRFSNSVHPLDAVLGPAAASLRDRILEAPDRSARFAAAEGWLLERCRGELPLNRRAVQLASRLRRGSGRVRDLVDELGISDRQARNIFDRWVGLTPKQFARMARFQAVLGLLAAEGEQAGAPDWADLAAQSGHADQSHLHHEFLAFAGMTPSAYAAAYRGLTNYLPITLGR